MIIKVELSLLPEAMADKFLIHAAASEKLKKPISEISAVVIKRRSIDARGRVPLFRALADVFVNEFPQPEFDEVKYNPVAGLKKVLIVGFGPAGMFAALRLIEMGIKPIIVERGKDVQSRRRDIRDLQQLHMVNSDSNYCFGEGGAGTFSDGKLYTRSTKRGDVSKILKVLIQHGAEEEIMVDTHPHIGSNKLPKIVTQIRKTILNCGGEIHFNSKATDLIIKENKILGLVVSDRDEILADAVILAAGHSARDIFYLLHKKKIRMEPKEFAMGVRIEHPQDLINEIQYHTKTKSEYLPAASYSLSCQIGERGVYSFCMCPGGIVVPASTAPQELVLNGMSLSKRNSPFANSGFVVTVKSKDIKPFEKFGLFAGLQYQMELERIAFNAGGGNQTAPAQRVTDFLSGKTSASLPKCSYIPGTIPAPLHELLPKPISRSLRKALFEFNKKMKGYISAEAQILAAETRTSSPIRIPRDKNSLMHPEIISLFPSGEGAGYAGGIVSAAIDGENCAIAAAKFLQS